VIGRGAAPAPLRRGAARRVASAPPGLRGAWPRWRRWRRTGRQRHRPTGAGAGGRRGSTSGLPPRQRTAGSRMCAA